MGAHKAHGNEMKRSARRQWEILVRRSGSGSGSGKGKGKGKGRATAKAKGKRRRERERGPAARPRGAGVSPRSSLNSGGQCYSRPLTGARRPPDATLASARFLLVHFGPPPPPRSCVIGVIISFCFLVRARARSRPARGALCAGRRRRPGLPWAAGVSATVALGQLASRQPPAGAGTRECGLLGAPTRAGAPTTIGLAPSAPSSCVVWANNSDEMRAASKSEEQAVGRYDS